MDRPGMRSAVAAARVGHLATVGADGRPHLVPVCFAVVGDMAYSAVDHKPKRGPRLRRITNIDATGRACLLVDAYAEDWSRLWWVRVDGSARVADDPAEVLSAIAALVDKYEQYAARPPAGPVIALDLQTWTGWAASRPPAASG